MKLILYGLNYAPELVGIGKYSGELAQGLAQRGHSVQVVTAPPYYPMWQVGAGYRAGRYVREQAGGVTVWRCPLWVPRKVSGGRRILHLASFALSSLPVMLRRAGWQPDAVVAVAPALLAAPGALLAGRLSGAVTWLHIQDFEVDAALSLGVVRSRGGLGGAAFSAERSIYRGFDVVSSISHRMVERLKAKGVDESRAVFFPNWIDHADIHPLQGENAYRRAQGWGAGEVVVLYSGSMGVKQGLEVLVEAARRVPQARFLICGEGPAKAGLVEAARGLDNVRFLGLQPAEQLNELLNAADIHALPQKKDASDLVMPSKLLGMLASARPVVAGCTPESELGRVMAEVGVAVEPEDAGAMAGAIARLVRDGAERARLGARGREYVCAHFSRESVLDQFEARLSALVG